MQTFPEVSFTSHRWTEGSTDRSEYGVSCSPLYDISTLSAPKIVRET